MTDTVWKKYGTTEKAKEHGYGVLCPNCGSGLSEVRDSRLAQGHIRRRRACQACQWKWTTYESNREPLPLATSTDRHRLIAATENFLRTLKAVK